MSCYVVTTGKGDVWVTYAFTRAQAVTRFTDKFPGAEIASIVQGSHF